MALDVGYNLYSALLCGSSSRWAGYFVASRCPLWTGYPWMFVSFVWSGSLWMNSYPQMSSCLLWTVYPRILYFTLEASNLCSNSYQTMDGNTALLMDLLPAFLAGPHPALLMDLLPAFLAGPHPALLMDLLPAFLAGPHPALLMDLLPAFLAGPHPALLMDLLPALLAGPYPALCLICLCLFCVSCASIQMRGIQSCVHYLCHLCEYRYVVPPRVMLLGAVTCIARQYLLNRHDRLLNFELAASGIPRVYLHLLQTLNISTCSILYSSYHKSIYFIMLNSFHFYLPFVYQLQSIANAMNHLTLFSSLYVRPARSHDATCIITLIVPDLILVLLPA